MKPKIVTIGAYGFTEQSFLPNTAPESRCDSSMGMKGAFLIWGQGKRGKTFGFSALDSRRLDAVY